MATHVQCPNCGSYNTSKTTNGKVSDVLAKTGAVVGGALLNMATGVSPPDCSAQTSDMAGRGTSSAATNVTRLSK